MEVNANMKGEMKGFLVAEWGFKSTIKACLV